MKKNQRSFALSSSMIFVLLLFILQTSLGFSQAVLPVPDHIIIAILENHSYSQIIGSADAPYINSLSSDSYSALFVHSYAIEHPSQPNYLDLYSGSNQGVINNDIPPTNPFTTANMGRQLIDAGKSFITYSEDLPYVGYNGAGYGSYVRKHNPATNWMGTGINQIPDSTNQPFSAFPSVDFTSLPSVCFVVPNQNNNMHDGTIASGDDWIFNNLSGYVEWTKTHNSLFILTFDEGDDLSGNQIATIFSGKLVKSGEYFDTINHYSVLRTIEDMYGLPYAGNASIAIPITNCWNESNSLNEYGRNKDSFSIYPNPSNGEFTIQFEASKFGSFEIIEIYNAFDERVFNECLSGSFLEEIDLQNISSGIYFVILSDENKSFSKKLIIQ
jgi:phosphatidylinositol-3-phosphatase